MKVHMSFKKIMGKSLMQWKDESSHAVASFVSRNRGVHRYGRV